MFYYKLPFLEITSVLVRNEKCLKGRFSLFDITVHGKYLAGKNFGETHK